MPKDYFLIAFRSFRAIAWLQLLLAILAGLTVVSEINGGALSQAIILFLFQIVVECLLCTVTARLFKKHSSLAVATGYGTLLAVIVLNAFFFGSGILSLGGLIMLIVIVCLLVVISKAARQTKILE